MLIDDGTKFVFGGGEGVAERLPITKGQIKEIEGNLERLLPPPPPPPLPLSKALNQSSYETSVILTFDFDLDMPQIRPEKVCGCMPHWKVVVPTSCKRG